MEMFWAQNNLVLCFRTAEFKNYWRLILSIFKILIKGKILFFDAGSCVDCQNTTEI